MLRNKIQGLEATDPDFPQLSLAERRRKLRIRTYIRLEFKLETEASSAIVTDISLDGMRIRCNREVKEGDILEVDFHDSKAPESGSIHCKVVWVTAFGTPGRESFEAGLTFHATKEELSQSWVKYLLEQMGFDEKKTFQKRRYLRANGSLPARIFTAIDGESFAAEILNLGVGGALLASKERLTEGSLVHCEICLWRILPTLRLPCKILSIREDVAEDGKDEITYLHSAIFLGMDTEQVKLLGNYVIFLINQSE